MKSEHNQSTSDTIKKLASIMTKNLKYCFDEDTKVRYDPFIVYKYCEWGLLKGYKQKDINRAFCFALFKSQVDARTATYENTPIPGFKSELSSSVFLARETLE